MVNRLDPISANLAIALLETYGSPLYVYRGDRLRQTLESIAAAIPYPHTSLQFASVTNGNLALLRQIHQAGWGLHANTPGDIYLGLAAGFAPSQIVYSGSNLHREEMQQVLDWGIQTLNFDSLSQLRLCCDLVRPSHTPSLRLGLRLNTPDLTGDSRIGVQPNEFPAAIALAQKAGQTLQGLHFYRGTGTNATDAFTAVLDQVLAIAQAHLPHWSYLDFGGGFGYPYRPHGAAFDWPEFGQAITARLETLNQQRAQPMQLILEPGRAAISGCGLLLTRVVSVKWQADKQIVGVDTSVANLSVPSVHGGYRTIRAIQPEPTPSPTNPSVSPTAQEILPPITHASVPTDVCGNTTYSRDYLGRNCLLPRLHEQDLLMILDVGAYGYAMSSHFLHRPRPAEVLLDQDATQPSGYRHRLIRQREDYGVLLSGQRSAISD
jgi:diaminopimelate decarboxylase